jgi:hypothetical protein
MVAVAVEADPAAVEGNFIFYLQLTFAIATI